MFVESAWIVSGWPWAAFLALEDGEVVVVEDLDDDEAEEEAEDRRNRA